jgi:hypothetical protein
MVIFAVLREAEREAEAARVASLAALFAARGLEGCEGFFAARGVVFFFFMTSSSS